MNFRDVYAGIPAFDFVDAGEALQTDFEKEFLRKVEPHPFVPKDEELDIHCREVFNIQTLGLCTRLEHIACKTAVIGVSGGLDSTLALLVTVMAFDKLAWERSRIIGLVMPGFGTSKRTQGNAELLLQKLGVTRREIPITDAVTQHLEDISHPLDKTDLTYENAQARERTQILMDVAGKEGGIVIGTGDLSELALGWCTYNGDHMSMYGVNASVPKTLVRALIKWASSKCFADAKEVLEDILDTPISPELVPTDADGNIVQLSETVLGPYELNDFFLYQIMHWGFEPSKVFFLARMAFAGIYDEDIIRKYLDKFYGRFFSQQFKRSCLPDGPKVGSVSLSPRGDWRMPSDVNPDLWKEDLKKN